MSLSTRELREHDYDRMRAFWESVGYPVRDPGPESREAVLRRMGLSSVLYLGLFSGDDLGGTVILGADGVDAWLRSLIISNACRAEDGVRTLLGASRERAAEWGAEYLYTMFAEPRGDLWERCLDAGCERIRGRGILRKKVTSDRG